MGSHVSKVAETLSIAMYLFGIGSGSLFAGPVSETIGRNPTYLVSTFCYLWFVLGCALTKSFGGQVRAFMFPVIAWANVAAPVIAPIAGGWIVDDPKLCWRWAEWVTLIISGAAFLIALLFLPETYLPLLLGWKAKHLRRVPPLPAKFWATQPVISVLGSYLVLRYVLLFSFLSGFDHIFKETYGFLTGQTEHVKGAPVELEFRLWAAIFAAPLLPIVLSYEYIVDSYGGHSAIGLASITMTRYLIAGGMVMVARPMYEGIGVQWTMTLLGCVAAILTPNP
ncbi:hypothetical protein GE09DRAFT_1245211 [Coniochaeta sp. 2T2.1]|nr:hypothetical protein GE09DRAFT_1245211 [Coniochaeta sp. 2T2.1]